jgi:hypothetical protein
LPRPEPRTRPAAQPEPRTARLQHGRRLCHALGLRHCQRGRPEGCVLPVVISLPLGSNRCFRTPGVSRAGQLFAVWYR